MSRKWTSGSIFQLRYGVDATWQLINTEVASQLLPGQDHQARGVFDFATAVANNEITVDDLPMTVRLTVKRLTTTEEIPAYLALPALASSSYLTIDSSKMKTDNTTFNLRIN